MKKVLIITYYFPPRPAVGSLRPAGLAKYLPEFGWEPIILTAKLPGKSPLGCQVIETPYKETLGFLKKRLGLDSEQNLMAQIAQLKKRLHIKSERSLLDRLLAAWGELTAYPDPQKGWNHLAVKAGIEYLKEQPVNAVISTSSPVTSHIIAKELKLKHGTSWVADFRDLWTQNHYYPYSRFRKSLEQKLELRTLSRADALVTVSEPISLKLVELHKDKKVYVIANGFDTAEVNKPEADLTNRFTITYTGNFYPGKQSPEPLFIALKDLIAEGVLNPGEIEVRFYGAEAGWVDKLGEGYGLEKVIKQYGIVPRNEALERQRESQLLLMIKWNDPKERGAYSAKIFEYLAARRPILAVGGFKDVVDELLDETNAGVSGSTPEEIKGFLGKFYQEYKVSRRVPCHGDEARIDRYSQREMARKFADVLGAVSN